jgi:hypothetical protein
MDVPGWSGAADRDPAQPGVADVVADLKAEGGVGVVVGQEARVDGDVHGGHVSCGSAPVLLDS